jgi:hypothetical protein
MLCIDPATRLGIIELSALNSGFLLAIEKIIFLNGM